MQLSDRLLRCLHCFQDITTCLVFYLSHMDLFSVRVTACDLPRSRSVSLRHKLKLYRSPMCDLLFMIRYRILTIMRSVGRDSVHRKKLK